MAKHRLHANDNLPVTGDPVDVYHFYEWLWAMAAPQVWRSMRRIPPREHLLEVIDDALPYARSNALYFSWPDDEPRPDLTQRGPLAEKLRALIERWDPPDLTDEIIATARALSDIGQSPHQPPRDWDKVEPDPANPPDEVFLWPEGVPRFLPEQDEDDEQDPDDDPS
jgi:hypothetical protein